MVYAFIDMICEYTTCVMRSSEVELLDVTGRRLVAEAVGDFWSKSADGAAMAGRLVVEVG
jgi:hypothetical protein